MRNKPQDIPYDGVDENKIKNSNPVLDQEKLKLYAYIQKERTEIYYKKEILKLPYPWTDDLILKTYSFTNTRREFDRESKILIQNVLHKDNIDIVNKLLNIMFCRMFYTKCFILNHLDEKFIDFNNNSKDYLDYLVERIPILPGEQAYMTSAYRTAAFKHFSHPDDRKVLSFFDYLYKQKDRIINKFLNVSRPSESLNKEKINGLNANFGVYQIFVDLAFTKEYPFSCNEYVLSGLGCHDGLKYLVKDFDGLNDEEFMFWLRDNIENLVEFNPREFFHFCDEDSKNWGVNEIENSFCEFSKYNRLLEYHQSGKRCKKRTYKVKDDIEIKGF